MQNLRGIVALGSMAYQHLISLYANLYNVIVVEQFTHNLLVIPENGKPALIASYHPSRQNTQTGRLTADMFDEIWRKARNLIHEGGRDGR